MDPVQRVLEPLDSVSKNGRGWKARCPAHDDRNPSLSINHDNDGKVLLRCFAGCEVVDIVRAIGLELKDLFPRLEDNSHAHGKTVKPRPKRLRLPKSYATVEAFTETVGGPCTTYPYQDAGAKVVLAVVRIEHEGGKRFVPLHPSNGGWRVGDAPGSLPLYGLRDIADAERVYVVEGEKCVEAARSIGLRATTSAHGSKSPHKADWGPVAGREVVVLPDNDPPGRDYAATVTKLVRQTDPPARVKIVEIPGLPNSGDIADYSESRDSTDSEDLKHYIERLADEAPVVDQRDLEPRGGESGLCMVCAADVRPENVRWLWPSRIAIGKLTTITGDPGLGKSFVSIDIASRVTRGMPWPDLRSETNGAGDVVILSAEDGIADTIVPRLIEAEADVNRVFIVRGVRRARNSGDLMMFDLQRDLAELATEVGRHPQTRLVIIDPLSAYLGSGKDSHKDAEVRSILAPLASLAERVNVAVVSIAHLNKSMSQTKAIYRSMGSLAFIAAARTVWLVCRDKDDPKHRLVLQVKNNLAPDPGGLRFQIAGSRGCVHWHDGSVDISADDALAEPRPRKRRGRDDAADWLRNQLADGPVRAVDVQDAAAEAGFSRSTLKRAKREIGVTSRRVAGAESTEQHWYWVLPRDEHAGDTDAGSKGTNVPRE